MKPFRHPLAVPLLRLCLWEGAPLRSPWPPLPRALRPLHGPQARRTRGKTMQSTSPKKKMGLDLPTSTQHMRVSNRATAVVRCFRRPPPMEASAAAPTPPPSRQSGRPLLPRSSERPPAITRHDGAVACRTLASSHPRNPRRRRRRRRRSSPADAVRSAVCVRALRSASCSGRIKLT